MTNLKKLEKKLHKKAFPKKMVGTQIFNYREKCHICGKLTKVDINAECEVCEKSMRKFRGLK